MARRRWMVWAALGAAFLAFELAAPLAVALPAECLLFGWNDAATACWCLRRDPIRSRGWLAAGLLGASALLKVGAGAFGVFFLTAAVAGLAGAWERSPVDPDKWVPPDYVMVLMFVAMGFMATAWALASLSCVVALWKRRQLWLGPEAGLARSQGVWPPWAADASRLNRPGPKNQLNLVLWLAFLPWVGLLVGVEVALAAPYVMGSWVLALVVLIACTVVLCPGYGLRHLANHLAASSPFEAWELEAP